ncbi:MAG: hypothetical protein AB2723_09765 [Candidatus Thiodiazotropha sp.]|nr:hypothetical protein [Candidatus Thiodiazotropha taylori]MBT3060993.1 hypothetical protein [Candidatus Thiodiazotropha sp. (ex Lucina pensylvanica)]MBT3064131.1 hypothetical protein [Candidatus Thiodiazotropha sp. (ex Lucina pensylvanica)]PUB79795.1 MAG: hypothetical protein DBO99_03020 [gamma proteobacterium symbiont of Ctena orbiculata]
MDSGKIKPNVPLLALIAALAAVVGATPYLFFIDTLWVLPLVAIGAAASLWVKARKLRPTATSEPTPGEWIAAAWSLVAYSAMISFSLIYYAIVYWVMRLVIYLLGLVNLALDISWAETTGLAVSLFFAITLYAVSLITAAELPRRLYPRLAGIRSPYYALWLTNRKWILLAVGAGIAALLIMIGLNLHQWYWIFACSAVLFYTGFPIAQSGEEREQRRKQGLKATRLLVDACGWSMSPLEASGDPEVDPFTDEIDFIARRNGDSLLVEVVAAEVDWKVASGLQTAARILEEKLATQASASTRLRPLLILVSDKIDASIGRFADIEEFDVAHVPETMVKKVLDAKEDATRLTSLARELMPAVGVSHA